MRLLHLGSLEIPVPPGTAWWFGWVGFPFRLHENTAVNENPAEKSVSY
jgi:hypothetical protein